MASSPSSHGRASASALGATSTSEAAILRVVTYQKQVKYLKQYWIFLGSLICAAILVHVGSLLLSKVRSFWRPSKSTSGIAKDLEKTSNSPSLTSPLTRVLNSLLTALRVIFTRLTVPIGFNSVASGLEVIIIVVYVLATLLWNFLDSELYLSLQTTNINISLSEPPTEELLA
jgi:hypothetical protein